MSKIFIKLAFAVILIFSTPYSVSAHCEIPCGIYDDQMRIELLAEHITTMEKSLKQIMHLTTERPTNYNQLVRWVMNKEDHANKFQKIVTQYFMTQRIKPDQKNYEKKVTLLHKMLVSAMKCKQTTDPVHIGKLRQLLDEFQQVYFENTEKK